MVEKIPEVPTIQTQLGDVRPDLIDIQHNVFEWDTYRWEKSTTLPTEWTMFDVPANAVGSGFAVAKDIGETSLLQSKVFRDVFAISAIHIEYYMTAAGYENKDCVEYLMNLMKDTTIEINRGVLNVLPESHVSQFGSANGLTPKFIPTDATYVTNGWVDVNNYLVLPQAISFLKGEVIEVKMRRNQNNTVLAAASPGELGSGYYYVKVYFRGTRGRQPQ